MKVKRLKKLLLALLIVLLLCGCTNTQVLPTPDFGKTQVLENGLCILTKDFPGEDTLFFSVAVRAGACYEPEGLYGLSHLLEHVIGRGMIEDCMAELKESKEGLDCNAHTGIQEVTYYIRCHPEDYEKALNILYENLANPDFSYLKMEKERWAMEAKNVSFNAAGAIIHEFEGTIFQDHPYGNNARGMDPGQTPFTELKATEEVLRDFHSRFYTAERMVLVLCGKADPEKAKEVFRNVIKGSEKDTAFPIPKLTEKKEIVKTFMDRYTITVYPTLGTPITPTSTSEIAPSYAVIGWTGFSPEEIPAFQALGEILLSRLSELRAEKGMIGVSSQMGFTPAQSAGVDYPGIPLFEVWLALDIGNPLPIKDLILQAIGDSKGHITEENLALSKFNLKASLLSASQSPSAFALGLAPNLLLPGCSSLDDLWKSYDRLTVADLEKALSFLQDDYVFILYKGASYH